MAALAATEELWGEETPALSWRGADVGKVGLAGSFTETDGVFTVRGAGGGVYIQGDAFYYVYQPLEGDGEITARVAGVRNTSPNTSLGVMIRERLEYDSRSAHLFLRPERGYIAAYQARVGDQLESVIHVAKEEGVRLPAWVRLSRRGSTVEGFLSADGKEWRRFGAQEVEMGKFVHIGLFLCSYRTNLLAEGIFDKVSVQGTRPSWDRFREGLARSVRQPTEPPPRDPRLEAFDALAQERRKERATLAFPQKKKLICLNQLTPPPREFCAHLKAFEQRPFDGVVLGLRGGERPFQDRAWDENKFIEDYEALAALQSQVFTDNFLWVSTSATIDWFDDRQWQNVLHNTRILARAALLGRCAGLWVDPEGYGANAWSYFDALGHDEKGFEEFAAQVSKRGEEWIRALQEELPAPRLLFAFLMPTTRLTYDLAWPLAKIREDIPRMRYALLPAFVNGLLRGADPNTVLVEGNEHAYYYRNQEEYENFARYVHELLPLAFINEDLRDKYARQVQIGSTVYSNFHFATHPRTLARHMTPEEQAKWEEHNLYWALKTADEYVWHYVEAPLNWWSIEED
jgi:hypothetical protein